MAKSSNYTVGQVADLLSSCKQHVATAHDSEQNSELLTMFGTSSFTTRPVTGTRIAFASSSVDTVASEKKAKRQEERNDPVSATKSLASKTDFKRTDSSSNTERLPKQKGSKASEEDNSKRTVFVGNLPVSVDKKMLVKLFSKFGEIKSIRFRSLAPSDPSVPKKVVAQTKQVHPQRNAMNAYIVFHSEEMAHKALKRNGTLIGSHHIRVDLASNSKTHNTKRSVFLGNLPFDVNDDAVRAHLEQCGSVENVRIIRDPKTGLGKGFGYLLFAEDVSVEFALKLDGSRLAGRNIRIQRAAKHKQKNVNALKRLQKKENVKTKGKEGARLQVGDKQRRGRPRESKSAQMRPNGTVKINRGRKKTAAEHGKKRKNEAKRRRK